MRARYILAFFAIFLTFINVTAAQAPFTVETRTGSWTDSDRDNREVPYKLYIPKQAQGALPVIIFSHGLGGSREGAVYLLDYLAAHGYLALAVQHKGSDTQAVFGASDPRSANPDAVKGNLRQSTSAAAAIDRFRDIPFAIDSLEEMNRSDPDLRGRVDLSRIGMSGHSYGAITTLALAGQKPAGGRISFSDARIDAAIAYSPSKPRQGDPVEAFAPIRIPTFHMTGTEDTTPLDNGEPATSRQIPYQNIKLADKYLLVFSGGDHMVFSGQAGRGGPRPNDEAFRALVQKSSLAYWDHYLRQTPEARAYLTDGGFKNDLGSLGTYEFVLR